MTTGPETAPGTAPEMHDYVELTRDALRMKRGSRGTIVDDFPDKDTYTVEVVDDEGATVDLVVVHAVDVRVLERKH